MLWTSYPYVRPHRSLLLCVSGNIEGLRVRIDRTNEKDRAGGEADKP